MGPGVDFGVILGHFGHPLGDFWSQWAEKWASKKVTKKVTKMERKSHAACAVNPGVGPLKGNKSNKLDTQIEAGGRSKSRRQETKARWRQEAGARAGGRRQMQDSNTPLRARGTVADIYIYIYIQCIYTYDKLIIYVCRYLFSCVRFSV